MQVFQKLQLIVRKFEPCGNFIKPSQVKFEQRRAKIRNISSTWDRDYFANFCLYETKKLKKIRQAFSMNAAIYTYTIDIVSVRGVTSLWMGFYPDIFLGIKMLQWNKSLRSFMSNFGTFWSPCWTPCERDVWKYLKLPKVDKRYSYLASFLKFTG